MFVEFELEQTEGLGFRTEVTHMTHKGTAELFEAPAIALRKLSAQTLPANERPGPGGRPHASNWWDPARGLGFSVQFVCLRRCVCVL